MATNPTLTFPKLSIKPQNKVDPPWKPLCRDELHWSSTLPCQLRPLCGWICRDSSQAGHQGSLMINHELPKKQFIGRERMHMIVQQPEHRAHWLHKEPSHLKKVEPSTGLELFNAIPPENIELVGSFESKVVRAIRHPPPHCHHHHLHQHQQAGSSPHVAWFKLRWTETLSSASEHVSRLTGHTLIHNKTWDILLPPCLNELWRKEICEACLLIKHIGAASGFGPATIYYQIKVEEKYIKVEQVSLPLLPL